MPSDTHLTEIWENNVHLFNYGLYFADEKQNWPEAMSKCFDVKTQSYCCPIFVVKAFTHFIQMVFVFPGSYPYNSVNVLTKCCFLSQSCMFR